MAVGSNDKKLVTYINALSKKGQITRLELLDLEINKTLSTLFNKEQVNIYELLTNTYEDNYFRNIYNMQTYFQSGVDFIKPNEGVIKNAVTQSWSNNNYSDKIWGHKEQLGENLRQHVTTGLIQGNSIDKMSSKISQDMNVGLNNAIRLVRTETNYVHNQATLDYRTSKQCQELDGKIFYTKDAEVGENYPPMHPNCRSTTVAYFEGDPVGKRIAKGADGKSYYVPADMTYAQWLNSLSEVDKDKMRLDLKRQYRYNQDNEQFERYKKVLGKEAPLTIAKFQDLKYNNNGDWEKLKLKYREENKKIQPSIEKGFKNYNNPKSIPDEYKNYINGLSQQDKEILKQYTGFTAYDVNVALRTGRTTENIDSKISHLDKVVNNGVLPENVILKRGTIIQSFSGFEKFKNINEIDLSGLKERIIIDKGFSSTSLINPQEMGRDVIMSIYAPKGFKGAMYLEPVAYDKYKNQYEILLKRGCNYRVLDAIIIEKFYPPNSSSKQMMCMKYLI